MCPSPCSWSSGRKVRTPWITPQRLTPSTHSQSASETDSKAPPEPTPALLHTTWTAPKASRAERRISSTCSAFETSATTVTTSTEDGRPAAAAARAPPSTSASTSFMPSVAKRFARARPMPLAPPVTTATLPDRSSIVSPSSTPRGRQYR